MTQSSKDSMNSSSSKTSSTASSNNNNNKNENKSIVDKFAGALFGPEGTFGEFVDDNTYERLQKCNVLQTALLDCQARLKHMNKSLHADTSSSSNTSATTSTTRNPRFWKAWFQKSNNTNNNNENKTTTSSSSSTSSGPRLEETRSGMKISRFYGWGLINPNFERKLAEMRSGDRFIYENDSKEAEEIQKSVSTASSSDSGNRSGGVNRSGTAGTAGSTGSNTAVATGKSTSATSSTTPTPSTISPSSSGQPYIYQKEPNRQSCSMENHAYWACKALALRCGPDLVQLKKCWKQSSSGSTNPQISHYNDVDDGNGGGGGGGKGGSNGDYNGSSCRMQQMKMANCVRMNESKLYERLKKRKEAQKEGGDQVA